MAYGDPTNNAQLTEELRREVNRAEAQAQSFERQAVEARERAALLQLRIDSLAPSVIKFVSYANDDRQRIHRALNSVRKITKAKGIGLDTRTAYNGDVLAKPAYISYPIGDGIGKHIHAALLAEGLAVVPWNGDEYRSIVVLPSFTRVDYRERHHYVNSDYSKQPQLILTTEHEYGTEYTW